MTKTKLSKNLKTSSQLENNMYKENRRYLVKFSGVQFTCTYDGVDFISDIDGDVWHKTILTDITELTGLARAKVGDIIVNTNGKEAKILEIGNSHTAFFRSCWDDFDETDDWYTFTEAEKMGYKLKDSEEDVVELTIEEIGKKFKVDSSKIRVKE